MDDLDATLLRLLADHPRIGVLEASRRLGVARGTVQARLDKLVAAGVISGWGPELEPEALGYPVTAFLTLEIRQGAGHQSVAEHLARIPEVLEAVTITGAGDMWARVVARALPDLQGQERGHRVAQRLRLELRPPAGDHPGLRQLVEPGLDRPAGDAEPAGRLEDPDPRLVGEQMEQGGIQIVHVGSRH